MNYNQVIPELRRGSVEHNAPDEVQHRPQVKNMLQPRQSQPQYAISNEKSFEQLLQEQSSFNLQHIDFSSISMSSSKSDCLLIPTFNDQPEILPEYDMLLPLRRLFNRGKQHQTVYKFCMLNSITSMIEQHSESELQLVQVKQIHQNGSQPSLNEPQFNFDQFNDEHEVMEYEVEDELAIQPMVFRLTSSVSRQSSVEVRISDIQKQLNIEKLFE